MNDTGSAASSVLFDGLVMVVGDDAVFSAQARKGGGDDCPETLVGPSSDESPVTPRVATVAVGDTISYAIEAVDSNGNPVSIEFPQTEPYFNLSYAPPAPVVNLVRTDRHRVLVRAQQAGDVPMTIYSRIFRFRQIPQDTALLHIR